MPSRRRPGPAQVPSSEGLPCTKHCRGRARPRGPRTSLLEAPVREVLPRMSFWRGPREKVARKYRFFCAKSCGSCAGGWGGWAKFGPQPESHAGGGRRNEVRRQSRAGVGARRAPPMGGNSCRRCAGILFLIRCRAAGVMQKSCACRARRAVGAEVTQKSCACRAGRAVGALRVSCATAVACTGPCCAEFVRASCAPGGANSCQRCAAFARKMCGRCAGIAPAPLCRNRAGIVPALRGPLRRKMCGSCAALVRVMCRQDVRNLCAFRFCIPFRPGVGRLRPRLVLADRRVA